MTEQLNDSGESTSSTINETLEQRGTRYGDFRSHSELSQALQQVILRHAVSKQDPNKKMEPYMVEALMMICHKLARIANGDPHYDDSWRDIAGYSQLVVDILHGKNT